MTLSRKEFLAQGILSLGRVFLPPGESSLPSPPALPVRPPGFSAGRETECGECDTCRRSCPQGVIVITKEVSGPVMEYSSAGCTLCRICSEVCPKDVLAAPAEGEVTRLGLARPGDSCLAGGGCFTCSERCPAGAITVTWGAGICIDPDLCTGCGWCEASCPVQPKAVRVEPLRNL